MKSVITRLAVLALTLVAMTNVTVAQNAASETAQESIHQARADAAFERGAYYFAPNFADHSLPLFWTEVDGTGAVLVYDTGASEMILIRDVFDLTPIETQNSGVTRRVEPPAIRLFADGNTYKPGWASDVAWAAFGFPEFVSPFIEGIAAPFEYEGKTAAFERNPKEGWFALFPSPHDAGFEDPVKIGLEPVLGKLQTARLKVRLPGSNTYRTLRVLVDTGFTGNLQLKSSLFASAAPGGEPKISGFTLNGSVSSTYVDGVTIEIGDKEITLNAVESVDRIPSAREDVPFDGLLGSQFLNRFHHIVDSEAGYLILELEGADLKPSSTYTPGIPAIVPHSSWTGGTIVDPENWANLYKVQAADIIYEVNGQNISPQNWVTLMDRALEADSSNKVCVFRPAPENVEATRFCFQTISINSAD